MNRFGAWGLLAFLVAATAAALWVPAWAVACIAAAAVLGLRRGRLGFLFFAAISVSLHAILLGLFLPGETFVRIAGVQFGTEGAWRGVVGGMRLVAAAGVNLAVLSWVSPVRVLDGLRLPPRASGLLGAVLLAAHDLARDFADLRDARRLEGAWPTRVWKRPAAVARLMPPLLVAAHRRASCRRDALRLAGHDVGARFVPIVAVTALAVAGRIALVAVPNVALTYLAVFLGGLLFGARVGVAAAALSMTLTDLFLSGLLPSAFVNVPAMMLVALWGAVLGRLDLFSGQGLDRVAGVLFAASAGFVGTVLFSVSADSASWLLVPEFRGDVAAWRVLVLAGLAFNLVPAVVNGVLFAVAVGPAVAAFRAIDAVAGSRPDSRLRLSASGQDGAPVAE